MSILEEIAVVKKQIAALQDELHNLEMCLDELEDGTEECEAVPAQ